MKTNNNKKQVPGAGYTATRQEEGGCCIMGGLPILCWPLLSPLKCALTPPRTKKKRVPPHHRPTLLLHQSRVKQGAPPLAN
jgi:hypothetical protein